MFPNIILHRLRMYVAIFLDGEVIVALHVYISTKYKRLNNKSHDTDKDDTTLHEYNSKYSQLKYSTVTTMDMGMKLKSCYKVVAIPE